MKNLRAIYNLQKLQSIICQLALGLFIGGLIACLLPTWWSLLLTLPFWWITKKYVGVFYIPGGISLGLILTIFTANQQHLSQLPPELINQKVEIQGYLADIPKGMLYTIFIDHAVIDGQVLPLAQKVKLKWAKAPKMLPGDELTAMVKIKPSHTLYNAGTVDVERLDFIQRITGRGKVISGQVKPNDHFNIARARMFIQQKVNETFSDLPYKDVLTALSIGVSGAANQPLFDLLRVTGTSHLMAISGLHVGLVAFWGFLFAKLLMRPLALIGLTTPRTGMTAALLLSFCYAMLAGFSLPTQRALVMVTIFSLSYLTARRPVFWVSYSLAFIVVFLLDPLCFIQGGFWLSFGAVFALGFVSVGLPGRSWFARFLGAQWAIFLLLTPISLFLFGGASMVAPLANIFAISWVSFVTVPLTFLAFMCLPFASASNLIWQWASQSVGLLHDFLSALANLPFAYHLHQAVPLYIVIIALIGSLTVLLPYVIRVRYLGLLLWAPLIFYQSGPTNGFEVVMLEVGQGLGVAIHTPNHTVLYDTGPGGYMDAGKQVILPYLRARGIQHLDQIIVSHGDLDHAGGYQSIIDKVPVDLVLSGEPRRVSGAKACFAGMKWQYDEVDFEILHPSPSFKAKNSNDRSCVLKVSNAIGCVLLTGDITKVVENQLQYSSCDVLQVPHHGSKTSSSAKLLREVSPMHALFSVGEYNPYGHPHPKILNRYRKIESEPWLTTQKGAIVVRAEEKLTVRGARPLWRRIWQRENKDAG